MDHSDTSPSLDRIRAVRDRLGDRVRRTPSWEVQGGALGEAAAAAGARVHAKLELFQHAGSFKPRGALNVMLDLDRESLARGVTAVSAGNHAMAVGYAARALGTTAKVVMPQNANAARVAACVRMGAEVVLVADVHEAFTTAERIERDEGRTFVHPFEGRGVVEGTATVGLEMLEQMPALDMVVVPIGGGGLCAGIAAAVKQAQPSCRVVGVEPEGADSMHRSFAAGSPQSIEAVTTIADSLGAPYALPYSFAVCRRHVDDLVKVSDLELRKAMGVLFADLKLAVEPAGAATTAALLGPLRGEWPRGGNVGFVVCGANTDLSTFREQCVE